MTDRLGVLPIQIRRMQLADLEQVKAIDRLSFTLPWSESAYSYELTQNPNSFLWVAETHNLDGVSSVVGLEVIWMIQDEAHLATIAVHPDYRGRGIARQLLALGLQAAVERGAKRAMLEVRAGNQAAQSLYHQFGFEIVGRRPRYYKDNFEDAVLMTAELKGSSSEGGKS